MNLEAHESYAQALLVSLGVESQLTDLPEFAPNPAIDRNAPKAMTAILCNRVSNFSGHNPVFKRNTTYEWNSGVFNCRNIADRTYFWTNMRRQVADTIHAIARDKPVAYLLACTDASDGNLYVWAVPEPLLYDSLTSLPPKASGRRGEEYTVQIYPREQRIEHYAMSPDLKRFFRRFQLSPVEVKVLDHARRIDAEVKQERRHNNENDDNAPASGVSGSSGSVKREIWIFGNPDKTELGFPLPGDLRQYIESDIFVKENGRYRYTLNRNADVIVVSRDGLAYGHLTVDAKVAPDASDIQAYPRVKCVYLIGESTLYETPVPLSSVGNPNVHFGYKMTEKEFRALTRLAGRLSDFWNVPPLPESPGDLERILREVKRRLGQSEFRTRLIDVYNARCCVSGCDVVEALEAAHIAPYRNRQSNDPRNGLLLRADIHTLFDFNLIGIDPRKRTVVLAPPLKLIVYRHLRGRQLVAPTDSAAVPDSTALLDKWREFRRGKCNVQSRSASARRF